MDIKAVVDGGLTGVSELMRNLPSPNAALMFAAACIAAAYFLVRSSIGKRARNTLEETLFSNWQLALLAATGIILSIASGYTTWDGMRNFTGEPVLSGMVTFGIQGVMLIVAWLIGESFATGMSQMTPGGTKLGNADKLIGMVLGLLLVGVTFYMFQRSYGGMSTSGSIVDPTRFSNVAIYFAFGLIIVAIIAFNKNSHLALPYVQSTRVIVKSAVLWVMFLACMATSVFFSFDSLFSAIFPQNERVRAAELRAQNQVAGIVADIAGTMAERRATLADDLFKSEGWRGYEKNLVTLGVASQNSGREIETFFVQQMEARRSGIAQQQERIATALSGQAGLTGRKTSLTEELTRLKTGRPELAADYAQHKGEYDTKLKDIDAKRVEALAEDKGVEGTGKVGKGQIYRQRVSELGSLQDAAKIKEERTKDAKKRLDTAESRIAQIERELSTLDGDIAKLKGEASTAESRIKVAQETVSEVDSPKIDPARVLPAFERARNDFRQEPNIERLSQIQQLCTQLYGAMASTPATKDKARGIDCDPKQAAESASNVFALNVGIKTFETGCAGGDKINELKSTDALFGFARKCLADSGLPSKDTEALRTKINFIDLSRDDKAHRFVVTMNAFQDGNRLAYLALTIAIAIDGLIFMSGLFGANAVRSVLSDVPSHKARSATQLEGIIENALLPHTFETAQATLHAMRPITPTGGYTKEVWMPSDGSGNSNVMGVLNAGAAIGAVMRDPVRHDHFLVRPELYEFLSVVAKKAFESDDEKVRLAQLEKAVGVALLRDIAVNVQILQDAMHPMAEDRGFSAEIMMGTANPQDAQVIRKVLNAGAAFKKVQRVGDDRSHFLIHSDLVRTLSNIQGRFMLSGGYHHQQQRVAGQQAGQSSAVPLRERQEQVENAPLMSQIAAPQKPQRPLTDEAVRQQFLDNLLMAIGVRPEIYAMATGPAIGAAISAANAFAAVRARNATLNDYLVERDQRATAAFNDAYSGIQVRIPDHDERRIDILNDAHEELRQHWPMLMLMPDGPYENLFEDLIAKLEPPNGSGNLTADQRDLLSLLKTLKSNLAAAQRPSADSWHKLRSVFAATDGIFVVVGKAAAGQQG